jgi:dTDP-glucose 4,6-dehydratase
MAERDLPTNTQDLRPNTQYPISNTHGLTPNTLLVTGGAGFIGSNFIRYALAEHPDWEITNLDKLTYAGNLENLKDIQDRPRYHFIKGDIADRKLVDALFSGEYLAANSVRPNTRDLRPNIVVNFAAESHVDRSILDASPFIETNVKGTQVLLEAARTHWLASNTQHPGPNTQHPGSKTKHLGSNTPHPGSNTQHPGPNLFLQVSTDEVYGSTDSGYFTEQSPLSPSSPYSASKTAADLLCLAYLKTHHLPVIVTRCTNNFGPYQFPEKLIPLAVTNVLEDRPVPVYGDGLNIRDWVFVDDHCRALDAVIQRGQPGQIYNIGGGNEKTNLELVHKLLELLDKPRTLIQFVTDRPAHDRRYALDCSKITRELGWKPGYSFEEALRATVDWYLRNQSWWRSIKSGEYARYYERMYSHR